MSFGDDLEDMGFDLGEEENLSVLTFSFKNDFGEYIKLQTEVPSTDVYPSIYLEQADRTVHNKFLGHSPEGKKHYKYIVDFRDESFWGSAYSFVDAGWIVLYDSREEKDL